MRRALCVFLTGVLLLSLSSCYFLREKPGPDPDIYTLNPSKPSTSVSGTDPDTDTEKTTDTENKDTFLTKDISDLTKAEEKDLAEYLFENYIPCSYGIFTDATSVSSPSVWSSVEALNRKIDGEESEESRKLENVLKKVKIYFPETEFDPEQVRVYNKKTKTFAPSPAANFEYEFISYEVKGDQITVRYKDKPDVNDPESEPVEYATTLKQSPAEGYFAFVSSVKTNAVG